MINRAIIKEMFDEWFIQRYSDECMCKDAYIVFMEKNRDRILEDFADEVGL